ncbi:uncharacterized protein A4U43_C03F17900 [Asparagus officinalis]|uniref:PUM-HD domain-containing protein n=1 Tax=Asparagus officinalis TaxID=4686 RepID=A0A5P1FCQ9_ASPOF|nr:putative pumilio homolog 7, chloroplastic [Asparagus officinalis]ONK75533.1 uncharacterized protein A4U43_C03F17900 [Asparagus officinalis]
MPLDKSEESEFEMLLNEIPHVTSSDYHHHDGHQHHPHRALPSPLASHDLHVHGHGHGMDGVNQLMDHLQSMYINEKSVDPFLLQRNIGGLSPRIPVNPSPRSVLPFNEIHNVGFSSNSIPDGFYSSKINGFDPYWDSNALNLSSLRSPTRSLSPVESFQNVERFDYNLRKRRGSVNWSSYDNFLGNIGSIYILAKDQHGCRYLQGKFDEGKHQVDLIFDGVIAHIGELMTDPFGNYLMQKLFDVCSEDQRMTILLVLTEDPATIFRISLDSHGTRSVQKLIETLGTRQQIALIAAALRPWLLDLIKDINGNHVIQHCLTCLRTEDTEFIHDVATKHCVEIATHRHGCCVLQRCIGCSTGECQANLIAKISFNGLQLAQDGFGNYVVQYIIGNHLSAHENLASQFEGNYVQLSMQKFSSNVVEKCFKEFGEDVKATIVVELLSAPHFEQLLQHPYANYVIQSALSYTKGATYTALVEAIHPHVAILRSSPYCKRIFSRLSKKSCAF